jgi:hypothetical protein
VVDSGLKTETKLKHQANIKGYKWKLKLDCLPESQKGNGCFVLNNEDWEKLKNALDEESEPNKALLKAMKSYQDVGMK